MDLEALIDRVHALVERGGRVVAIAGVPGSGKSTLAAALVHGYNAAWGAGRAEVLALDGFHLADEELARLGRSDRKGAPDTFDVDGYLAALARVRAREHDVLVPRFDRDRETAIAGAVRIGTEVELVVTEGNYLLVDDGRWAEVRSLVDETWMLEPDDAMRVASLVARHERHGRSPEAALAWVRDVDEVNARVVRERSSSPTLRFDPYRFHPHQ